MQKFRGVKSSKQIIAQAKAQAKAQGVAVDDYNYRKFGADHIALGVASGKRPDGSPLVPGSGRGCVMFNTCSGRFFGVTDKGVRFCSDSSKHDKQPWMQALLSFFLKA